MKIEKINLPNLRNEEHFNFHTEFRSIATRYGVQNSGLKEAISTHYTLYEQEEACCKLLEKCATTEQLINADEKRDTIFRGLFDTVISANNHFNPAKKSAAQRLGTLLFQYCNAERKAYNDETIAYNKLALELFSTYANDIVCIGITDWVEELVARNKAFDLLMKSKYSEGAEMNDLALKQIRIKIDEAYRAITYRIDALIIINGSEKYTPFIIKLNSIIEPHNAVLAKRKNLASKNIEKMCIEAEHSKN